MAVVENGNQVSVWFCPDMGMVVTACRRRDQTVRVESWGTGIGIAPEYQHDIFRDDRLPCAFIRASGWPARSCEGVPCPAAMAWSSVDPGTLW